ncbi:MAG TPA: SDR family NAD(P)-dependent oxidoreductase [bacterium]|nr:SDR family NAD(P)-dependent oxidoreductase [bacterium]
MAAETLKGKRILVTGASGGIGQAIARALAADGARLGLQYGGNAPTARKLAAELGARHGIDVCLFKADLTRAAECRQLARAFVKEFRGCDALINNAGGACGAQQLVKLRLRDWERTLTLNATAPFLLAQGLLPALRKSRGRIINISSIAAKYGGGADTAHYACAKAALECLTKALAKAGAADGVTAVTLRLGVFDTPFARRIGRTAAQQRRRVAAIPLRRMGEPEEAAAMVRQLLLTGYMTGSVVELTGGD